MQHHCARAYRDPGLAVGVSFDPCTARGGESFRVYVSHMRGLALGVRDLLKDPRLVEGGEGAGPGSLL